MFDYSGTFLRKFGSHGSSPGLRSPLGLTLDSAGNFLVVEWRGSVHVFKADGGFITAFGEKGGNPGQFCTPEDVCVDSHGRIWVTDCGNHRLQVFGFTHAS